MSTTPPSSPSSAPTELPKAYRPADHEGRIWERWIASKAFHADPQRVLDGKATPYAILIPPPNVTDRLHLGHGLNNTLQDILARYHRMKGDETLWMPGTDHAGIATQAVVERRLRKEGKLKGPLRESMKREEFIAIVQAFKDEYEATITGQLQKMGCSCDWERQRFTMDPMCAAAVREAFFRLFKDGLIYRGKRLVNWDPALQTAVADDECYDEEVDTSFWYLRYPLVHASRQDAAISTGGRTNVDPVPVTWGELARRGYAEAGRHGPDERACIVVATTRPETYLGDTAVAVNPHDPRAKALRGLFAELPLVGRVIPIVEDNYVVLAKAHARTEEEANDPKAEFATGFLKVTPAHDTNDYELGRRHGLDIINMMAPDGSVSDKHGWTDIGDAHMFVGKKRDEARKMVVSEFQSRGLLEATKPYKHSVKHSDRSKAIIEPYLSDQWYVAVRDEKLASAANAALVQDQRTSTSPTRERGVAPGSPERVAATGAPSARAEGTLASGNTDASLRFHPSRYAKTYEQWHDGIRDWCISRQLWWGHRIPVWRASDVAAMTKEHRFAADGRWMGTAMAVDPKILQWQRDGRLSFEFDRDGPRKGQPIFICVRGSEDLEVIDYLEDLGCVQDPDVLDTWFSSGLWPLSTMGWPNPDAFPQTKGLLEAFNRNDKPESHSTLCTAREIITLWVSRMVMFNRYFRATDLGMEKGHGPVPFKDVFIHAIVQDGNGHKMSKSAGNGVDPLDIIASHGADAMRFTLCKMSTQTQDVRMPVVKDSVSGKNTSPKFDEGRNFCNKLWNAARFAMAQLGTSALRADTTSSTAHPPSIASTASSGSGTEAGVASARRADLPLLDRWMLSRLATCIGEINSALHGYHYAEYAQTIYDLLWRDFCDWYLEGIKATVAGNPAQQAVLAHTLEAILRLLHPIAPFVTEAIFEHTRHIETAPVAGLLLGAPRKDGTLATAGWPVADSHLINPETEAYFERMRTLVTAIREVRAQLNVQPKRRITLLAPTVIQTFIADLGGLVESLGGIEKIENAPTAKPDGAAELRFDGLTLYLTNLADAIDAGSEKPRLEKLSADLKKSIATLEGRLNNPGYADRAPAAMVQQSRDQLSKAKADLAAAEESLKKLG